jgi:(E)-4-hydroxy-3-methylbut-2-enyl-diphosphate synthase
MTNTPTRDIEKTVEQIIELVDAGSELVRITINDDTAAAAVPEIIQILKNRGKYVPII